MLDVLLVEGDKVLAELIKERLESSELRVFCTCSGAETLFFLESRSADLVLLNYKLPDYSGKTLIEKIHKSDSCPPFVIFTDPGEEGVILEMMKLGAIDYLVKDLFFKDLLPHVVSRVTAKIEMEQKFKRSEKTLYEREERINRAEIASKAGNWEFQLETNVMIASLGATKIYGVGIDRMDFEYVRNVPLPEYRPILDQALKNLIEKDEPYNLEFRIRAMDSGEIKDIHSIATYNREKRTLFGIIHDITEKKEIERKIKLMAHALESISECVSVTDTEDRIIYVNESLLRTYGYEESELIGRKIGILRPAEIENVKVRSFLPKTGEGAWRGEIMNKRKDGTLFPILLSSSVINDERGRLIALIGVALDITEMRKSRKELEAAKEQAIENSRLKSALLNNLSHEIRTPMNAIMGFSDLMLEADSDEKNAYAKIINGSSNQLLSLIDDVILLSRLQSEKMPLYLEKFKPTEMVSEIRRMFDHPTLNKGLLIRENVRDQNRELTLLADVRKIRQVLTNFVSNALKYTFDGFIELGYHFDNKVIEFFVRDTGMGVSKREQQLIFDTFYRGEEAINSAIRGTGLGLNIAREIVDLMDGEIGVDSELNLGSRFYFRIPVEIAVSEEEPVPLTENVPDLKEISLLIVDDEEFNSRYLEVLLQNRVKTIDLARNGQEAVDMAFAKNYHMILMDLKMPVMDGLEATRIIKSKYPRIPVIAQTACVLPEDKEVSLKAGCDGILYKPIEKEKILEVINKYFDHQFQPY